MSLKNITIKSHEISWPRPPIILGTGRLGKVYKVQYQGRDVAIKSSNNDMTAILEDFQIYNKLRRCEFVLKFLGFMLRGDKIALIIEYAANGTLNTFLKRNQTIGWELRAKLCHDIALGLFHCHEENIVNYNLKPENIYLTTDLTPKLTGFISDKRRSEEDVTLFQPTGTIHWVAPEVVAVDLSMKKYFEENPKFADIYTFGLILWSVGCNGAIPYDGMLRDNILSEKKQFNTTEVLRTQLPADCPFEFSQIFLKITRHNPRQRAQLLYVLVVLEGLFNVRPELPDHTMSFSKSSSSTHTNTLMRYASQDDLAGDRGPESDTNSQHALINHNNLLTSATPSINNMHAGFGTTLSQRPLSPINDNPQSDAEMLDEVIQMYVEAEKYGFDWLAKNLKQWTDVEDNDPKKIFELLYNGGERRHRDCVLGYFFEEGFGTHRDTQQAYNFYRKAADNGEAAAQNHLGLCYQDGIGVERDSLKAFDWFKEAASAGNAAALNNLAQCYDYGKGTGPNRLKAFLTYKKAAEGGNVSAQYSLALCYDGGYGTTKDKRKAAKWLTTAANNGSTAAIETLAARKKKKKNCIIS
ncbi:hypothetical protein G9A89_009428 [Geosiphon pyriformis]|nr:hypothetical protein G9A89_009428 [Geosiphon pyriformis]